MLACSAGRWWWSHRLDHFPGSGVSGFVISAAGDRRVVQCLQEGSESILITLPFTLQDGKVVDKVEGFVPAPKLQDRVNFRLDRPLGPGRSYKGP